MPGAGREEGWTKDLGKNSSMPEPERPTSYVAAKPVDSYFGQAGELWNVPSALLEVAERAERMTAERRTVWRRRGDLAFLRVLKAFQDAGVTEGHLGQTTGYGYDDAGRETLDRVYARLLGAEAALVRMQIVSGTHALSLCLRAAVGPADVLVSGTGAPYDTLRPQIEELKALGARYLEVTLGRSHRVDVEAVAAAVGEAAIVARVGGGAGAQARARVGAGAGTRVGEEAGRKRGRICLFLQRSRGYEPAPSRDIDLIARIVARCREEAAAGGVDLVTVVDNCYGELVEEREPTAVGADLIGGSLIKNPGGGLAPTGGYVAGRADLVERAGEFLTAPGVGGKCGPTLGVGRLLYQGLFLAPRAVASALAGATFAAAFFESLGLDVSPRWDDERTDIIQSVRLGGREAVLAFARGVQRAAPVDSAALPEPAPLPGYDDEVIMAAGTFVQGASIELSLDAPLRVPYVAYLQGGLYEAHLKLASLLGAAELWRNGRLKAIAPPVGGHGPSQSSPG